MIRNRKVGVWRKGNIDRQDRSSRKTAGIRHHNICRKGIVENGYPVGAVDAATRTAEIMEKGIGRWVGEDNRCRTVIEGNGVNCARGVVLVIINQENHGVGATDISAAEGGESDSRIASEENFVVNGINTSIAIVTHYHIEGVDAATINVADVCPARSGRGGSRSIAPKNRVSNVRIGRCGVYEIEVGDLLGTVGTFIESHIAVEVQGIHPAAAA